MTNDTSAPGPEILIIGHITKDEVSGDLRLGGAASFASRVAAALGFRTALVTAAPANSPFLAELTRTPNLSVHCRPSAAITSFSLDYDGITRRVIRLSSADELRGSDIPAAWKDTPIVYLGPVAQEFRGDLLSGLSPTFVGLGAQGWMRAFETNGLATPDLSPEMRTPPPGLGAAIFSEDDHPEADSLAARLSEQGVVVALTRGARGATVFAEGRTHLTPAARASLVDPTGAGDAFGVVFTLALARGRRPFESAALAAEVAARVVEGPGVGRLATVAKTIGPLLTVAEARTPPPETTDLKITMPVAASIESVLEHEALRRQSADPETEE